MSSKNLGQIVNGEIKHARQQELRERANRLGLKGRNRRVLDEMPAGLAAAADLVSEDVRASQKLSRLEWLRQQIWELAERPKYLELLKRVLLNGESIRVVSDALGIRYSTARTVVARTKRSLMLPIRRKVG